MDKRDKYLGCMIGGAAGDALGYAVEFMSERGIFDRYGKDGITQYSLNLRHTAEISDDTQMTMFTANGLLYAEANGIGHLEGIAKCYRDWYQTQLYKTKKPSCAWLGNLPELCQPRAPGNTCMNALGGRTLGSVDKPLNHSKGCGGIMRIAPIGLFFGEGTDIEMIDMLAAEASALTHGHELGYIPSAIAAHMVHRLCHCGYEPKRALNEAIECAKKLFPKAKEMFYLELLLGKAAEMSEDYTKDLDAIHKLGEGWVAEETLAIAVYCTLKYHDDFEKALIASVNHNGDSDSTGAVTGSILGAYLGYDKIPDKFKENLELREVLTELADDLLIRSMPEPDEKWRAKYVDHTYPN